MLDKPYCTLRAVLAGGLGTLIWGISQGSQGNGAGSQQEAAAAAADMQPPREDAVLVFGSTGKLGRQIVAQVSILSTIMGCMPTQLMWGHGPSQGGVSSVPYFELDGGLCRLKVIGTRCCYQGRSFC